MSEPTIDLAAMREGAEANLNAYEGTMVEHMAQVVVPTPELLALVAVAEAAHRLVGYLRDPEPYETEAEMAELMDVALAKFSFDAPRPVPSQGETACEPSPSPPSPASSSSPLAQPKPTA